MNPCEDFDSHLLLYLDNALDPQEAKNMRAHLQTCANCRARLEEEQELSRLLKRSRPLYSAPQQLRARVSAIERESTSIPARRKWWHGAPPWFSTWRILVPAVLAIALALLLVPNITRKVRASSYVETAIATHAGYLNGSVKPDIRSSSPEVVAAWFLGKVPFQLRLRAPDQAPGARSSYRLIGASLVVYRGSPAALVLYETQSEEKISLLVASSKSAIVGGGDEIRFGTLTFHYRSQAGFEIITWSNLGLSYALVSSISGSARESCLVCHQNMADRDGFKPSP
jgi:mycothiol system anti-sigma-R factor